MDTERSTKQLVNEALKAIGENGLSGVVCEATSLSGALSRLLSHATPAQCDRVAAELHRQKLVEVQRSKKRYRIQPSVKAVHRLQRAALDDITVPRPANWDGMWRMVTYDVPMHKSADRRLFASQLRRLGFSLVRESVWFHPYPCFTAVTELATHCGLQRYVTFAEISRLDTMTLARLELQHPGVTARRV